MAKCLVCGEEAVENTTLIDKEIDRFLCSKHEWMLKGWLVGEKGSDYSSKIESIQKYIDEFVEKFSQKTKDETEEEE